MFFSFWLIASWSAFCIILILLYTKSNFIRPSLMFLLVYAAIAGCATGMAGFYNNMLRIHTPLKFFEGSYLYRILSFLIGAGMGEEFWKMSAGLLGTLIIVGLGYRIFVHELLIGFCVTGAIFALLENVLAYYDVGLSTMFLRSLLTVPLHITMSFFHAIFLVRSVQRQRIIWIFVGYALTVLFHTGYDVLSLLTHWIMEHVSIEGFSFYHSSFSFSLQGIVVLFLVRYCYGIWKRVPEGEPVVLPTIEVL